MTRNISDDNGGLLWFLWGMLLAFLTIVGGTFMIPIGIFIGREAVITSAYVVVALAIATIASVTVVVRMWSATD